MVHSRGNGETNGDQIADHDIGGGDGNKAVTELTWERYQTYSRLKSRASERSKGCTFLTPGEFTDTSSLVENADKVKFVSYGAFKGINFHLKT